MSAASDYAFVLAYKAWLESDAHYWRSLGGKQEVLEKWWLRKIGQVYLVNRTIPGGDEQPIIDAVTKTGQDNDMPLEERAARISGWLGANGQTAASAVSKISWFIWPAGWTMFDRLAARAVIGGYQGSSLAKFERFYAALAMRGWADVLASLRAILNSHGMQPLLAERTVDKYLMLTGMDKEQAESLIRSLESFLAELPAEFSEQLRDVSKRISAVLAPGDLLNRKTTVARRDISARMEQFNTLKNRIA